MRTACARALANAFASALALWVSAAVSSLPAQSTHEIRGRVRDTATDAPLSGAVIEIVGPGVVQSTRTSGDGLFVIRRIPAGSYAMMARRLGYAPVEQQITVDDGDISLAINLRPMTQELARVQVRAKGAGVYGRIGAWPTLAPLTTARVRIMGSGVDLRTDTAGSYFASLKPGPYLVRVTATGFAEQLFSVSIPKDSLVEASRLMDPSVEPPNPAREAALWEAALRLRVRGPNSALISGDELRGHDRGQFITALKLSRSFAAKGLRFGQTACVFLNGRPMPNWPLSGFSPEDVESVEVYAPSGDTMGALGKLWPRGVPCAETGEATPAQTRADVKYVVIWTKQ